MEAQTYMQWIVATIVNMSLFTYGLQSGWMSPVTKILKSNSIDNPIGEPLKDTELSWIASIMCISAMCSVPFYSYTADKYGRKISIIIVTIFQILTWLIKIIFKSSTALILARIMCGLASGGCFNVVPIYTKEISQDSIRGFLGSLLMLFQNMGILVMYAMGSYLNYYTVLWISIVFPILNLLLLLKAPESPAFLVKTGKIDEATAALTLLRGLDENNKLIQCEISQMRSDDIFYKSLPKISIKSIFTDRAWRKSVFLAAAIITIQASNGNFSILTYAAQIISASGVTFSPDLQTLSFPAVLIFGSLLSMTCVEKFGRKTLLAFFLLLASTSIAVLATILMLQNDGKIVPGWLPVLMIVVSVFANGAGVMPIPYIIMSETFNFQIRAKVIGMIVTYAWFVSFVQLLTFEPISNALGMHSMFYVYAGVNLLGAVITLVLLPETRGKSIEEIENELRGEKEQPLCM